MKPMTTGKRASTSSSELVISQHAIERFVERHDGPLKNPEKTIRKLWRQATPETLDPVRRTLRIMSNRFQDAEDSRADRWRFVVVGNTLVTCELPFED